MAGTPPSWVGVSGPDPAWDGASEGKVVEGSVGGCGWLLPRSCVLLVGAGPPWCHCSLRVTLLMPDPDTLLRVSPSPFLRGHHQQ